MTFLDRVEAILADAATPLHYREITDLLLTSGVWTTSGKTPEATVNARISSDIKRKGPASRFIRVSPGTFTISDGSHQLPEASQPRLTFLDAAERVLTEFGESEPMHYRDITAKALELELLETRGLTPEATMYAQIVTHVNRKEAHGEIPRFTKLGKGMVGLTMWVGVGIHTEIASRNRQVREELMKRIRGLDPSEFEELVGRLLAEVGFDEIELTKYHGDKGIDLRGTLIVAGGIPIKMAIQVKRWGNAVQAPEVQKVRGATSSSERGLIITTSSFSKGAIQEAERLGFQPVGLIDGQELVGLMIEHEVGVSRKSYDVFELEDPS